MSIRRSRTGAPARPLAAVLLGALALSGCFRANRPAPVEPGTLWPTQPEGAAHRPYEDQEVPRSRPSEAWRADPHRGFAAPPAISGQALISVSTNRMVQAISLETGEIFWEHRKNGPLEVPPLIARGRIFVATSDRDGVVYALRLTDGRERWDRDQPGVTVPMAVDSGRVVLADAAGQVRTLNVENGNTIWRTRVGPVASAPVLAGDRILVSTDQDSLLALDRRDGRILERRGLPAQASGQPAYHLGTMYLPLHGGDVLAIRASDLSQVWRVRAGATVLAAPVASRDGSIYLLDRSGGVWTVGIEGELRRLAALQGVARGSLTLTGNAVLVGLLDGTFTALDRDSGEVLWTIDLGDSIYTPVVVHGGAIYVPLRRGELVKLQ